MHLEVLGSSTIKVFVVDQSLSHVQFFVTPWQHTRFPCHSPSPIVCSNSCPSSWWCHPTISSSVITFSSCLQLFPASGSFEISQLSTSSGQSTGDSALALVFPMNIQDLFALRLDGLISLQSKSSLAPQFKSINSALNLLYSPILTSIQDIGKTIALVLWTFAGKVMSLLFNMLSTFAIISIQGASIF